jgi:hypothetical protein
MGLHDRSIPHPLLSERPSVDFAFVTAHGRANRALDWITLPAAAIMDRFIHSTQRRRLSGRTERRGSRTGLTTVGALAFGFVFVASGTFIVLVGSRVIPVDPKSVHAPWWVLSVAGLIFVLGGVMVWGMAARQYRSERRQRDARRHSNEPALADYPWDARGFVASRWGRALKGLATAAGLTLFMSIFNYWAFWMKGPWMVKAVTVFFDLFVLAAWWAAVISLGRALKYGGSRIEFVRFPYKTDAPVIVRWYPAAGITQVRDGTFTLRSVEEWFVTSGHGKNRSQHLVQEETWSGTWHLDQPKLFGRGEIIELSYDLPEAAPTTRLSAEKPVFWEFEVKLNAPGLDFEEVYLVPIYGDAPDSRAQAPDI